MNQKGSPRFAVEAGFTPVVLLIGVLVIAAIIGGAFYVRSVVSKPLPAPQYKSGFYPGWPNASGSAYPSSTSDPTADWKTYSNTLYSFKYPNDWAPPSAATGLVTHGLCNFILSPEGQTRYLGICDSVGFSDITDNASFIAHIKKEGLGTYKLISEQELTIDNHKAMRVETEGPVGQYAISNSVTDVISQIIYMPSSAAFHIDFTTKNPVNLKSDEALFDQIMSTFKFN